MTSGAEIVRRLGDLTRRVDRLGGPQLGHSSLEAGAVPEYDASGQLVSQWGTQHDGTHGIATLAGPVPPTATVPTVTPEPSGIKVTWDGHYADSDFTVAPMDFARVEIHVSPASDLDGMSIETRKGAFESARGGEFIVHGLNPATNYYVRLTTWSTAGKYSTPTAVVGPVQPMYIPAATVDIDFEALGTQVFYGSTEPTTDKADLWLEVVNVGPPPVTVLHRYDPAAGQWKELQSQDAADAVALAEAAQTAAAQRARLYVQPTAPTGLTASDKAIWVEDDNGNRSYTWNGAGWDPRLIGNGAIQPNSLVASNVIATGTVSAALLEALIVLSTTIIAGNPDGAHASMTSTGFRVFREDPDGVGPPEEVIRLGTDTNDFLGVVDSLGNLAASLDDTGAANIRTANIREDPVIMGIPFSQWIGRAGGSSTGAGIASTTDPAYGAENFYGWADGTFAGVTTELGLIEMVTRLSKDRAYLLMPLAAFTWNTVGGEVILKVRDGGTGIPTTSSTQIYSRQFSNASIKGYNAQATSPGIFLPSTSGVHRLLLTAQVNFGGGTVDIVNEPWPSIYIIDLGPRRDQAATVNRGGGATPPPVQQYFTELQAVGKESFRGNGTLRTDLGGLDIVQGWDPSGYNGDGKGYYWFNLPTITGTVDRVDLYLYTTHWYYNSGGTAVLNATDWRGGAGSGFFKLRSDWHVTGYPKPGTKTVTLPADWFPLFAGTNNNPNNGRAMGITIGPGGGTNLTYYGRFSDVRLRIWYSQ